MKPDQASEPTYLINDVAKRVDLSQKRIREYEKGGLIRPVREPKTNNRRYTEKDISQIMRIKALIHIHGFTLASLRYMVANLACWLVFGCDEKVSCPAYADPAVPCYEIAARNIKGLAKKNCDRCPVYLNRHFTNFTLLEKPLSG